MLLAFFRTPFLVVCFCWAAYLSMQISQICSLSWANAKQSFVVFPLPMLQKGHATSLTHEASAAVCASEGTIAAPLAIISWKFYHCMFDQFILFPCNIPHLLSLQGLNKPCFKLYNVYGSCLPFIASL